MGVTSSRDSNDTIVAISTPSGRGGIGIVRLSGSDARRIAEMLVRLRSPLAAGRARFAEIIEVDADPVPHVSESRREAPGAEIDRAGAVLDQAVVTFFATPNSYTSEDVVEIAAHGSPILMDYLVRKCVANGARLAEPGEFTQRAFSSGAS